MADLDMLFSIAGIVAVEERTGLKLSDIISATESEEGLSLGVLRALVAAGSNPHRHTMLGGRIAWHDEDRADRLLTEHGLAACAAGVGVGLAAFLRRLDTAEA